MDKDQIAAILDECGTLLEIQGENPFRCNAYHNAARAIQQLESNLADVVAAGELEEIPGIGSTMREKIVTMLETGALPFYEELKTKVPAGVLQMLRIPGLGPKKAKALYEQLGIDTIEKLQAACEKDAVAELKGFGAKTQSKIMEGISFLGQGGERVRIDQALPLAQSLLDGLRGSPGLLRMELCGSLRRRRETIRDIDILISAKKAAPIMERFVTLPGVVQVVAQGETKSSIIVSDVIGGHAVRMNADLRVVSDEQFPFALNYFTGSKEHNVLLRGRAQKYGLKLNEYELAGAKKSVACKEEADIYKALDLDYIQPEMREATGEIEAAAAHHLPDLLKAEDIRGTFHCHTTESDGGATLEQMVDAARKLGLEYLGIADHSQSLKMAKGLTPARVKKQQAVIDKLNAKLKGFRVFKGSEVDILPDGRLDFKDPVLASFDYVVASVHTQMGQSEEDMTRRIIRAVTHPHVTMLGHATGRLLLKRDAYKLDLEAVLKAAAKHGTMIEINAHPYRLDIDWVHCKRAKALGVQLVINPDAHSTEEIACYRWGVDVARRGWLEKKDVFNTKTAEEVAKALEARRTAKDEKP
jgi:DNA polymerase (family 10)